MRQSKNILVTGANGFVGRLLVPYLADEGFTVSAAMRSLEGYNNDPRTTALKMPDLSESGAAWMPLLTGIDVIIHTAGIAHTEGEFQTYDQINHLATAAMVRAAQQAHVEHFIFISSILAQTGASAYNVLTEQDIPTPKSAYGKSKLAAELAIKKSGIKYTILRPVVIYGDRPKGNLATLIKLASLPIPLPFGSCTQPRSILMIENFNSAVRHVLTSESAINQVFIVADTSPLSLSEMITQIRQARGIRRNLVSIPTMMLNLLLRIIGKSEIYERICQPLVASPERLLNIGWNPLPTNLRKNIRL
ncbi:MAG TPA: NAD-dependent epimerase/dehydratase family protein [Afipia sp.]